ncbi:HAD family hydrolase [Halalkalibacter urbisdiaboli]|uniref:HAD family hydrolase n=1 Tax=Halalkalibacter urbisdiaboli TaxID=1960589 RepID=UPI0013FE4900|nr:HAD family hydrolase [Halalkalibacter urbisdiaboli]
MKAILFDLYETLITERENGVNIMDFGTPECQSPASILGISEELFEDEWVKRRPGRMTGVFSDYFTVLKDICTISNLDADDNTLRELNEKRIAAKRLPYQNISIDIVNTLKELKRNGVKIGLVSNCSAEETESLFLSPLFKLIDEMILSYQEGVSKPSREIYMIACQRLDVKPSEAIFIGDGGANELVGAKNSGIEAFRAKWFYNRKINNDEFPSIEKPMDLLNIVKSRK